MIAAKVVKESEAALIFQRDMLLIQIKTIERKLPSKFASGGDPTVVGDKRTIRKEGQYAGSDDDDDDDNKPLWATGSDCTPLTGLDLGFEKIR